MNKDKKYGKGQYHRNQSPCNDFLGKKFNPHQNHENKE